MGKTLESPRCLCHRFLLCYCRSIYLLKNNIPLKRNWRHQSNFHNQYNCFWTGSIFGLCFLLNVTSCESGLRTEAISIWTVISWQSRIGMDLQMDFRVSNRDFHEICSNTEMARPKLVDLWGLCHSRLRWYKCPLWTDPFVEIEPIACIKK